MLLTFKSWEVIPKWAAGGLNGHCFIHTIWVFTGSCNDFERYQEYYFDINFQKYWKHVYSQIAIPNTFISSTFLMLKYKAHNDTSFSKSLKPGCMPSWHVVSMGYRAYTDLCLQAMSKQTRWIFLPYLYPNWSYATKRYSSCVPLGNWTQISSHLAVNIAI